MSFSLKEEGLENARAHGITMLDAINKIRDF